LSAEADKKGLIRKDKGDYIKATVDPYTKQRADQRDATVKERVE
jgi:hypothetical protein